MQSPVIQQIIGSRYYRVHEPYTASSQGLRVTVHPGYRYDGASIPRMFWRLIGGPFSGAYAPAALVHDALYETQMVSRAHADRVFYDLMRRCGEGRARAKLMYWGVRAGGWTGWNSYAPDRIRAARELVTVETINVAVPPSAPIL